MGMYTLVVDDSSLNKDRLLPVNIFILASFHELGRVGAPDKRSFDISNGID